MLPARSNAPLIAILVRPMGIICALFANLIMPPQLLISIVLAQEPIAMTQLIV